MGDRLKEVRRQFAYSNSPIKVPTGYTPPKRKGAGGGTVKLNFQVNSEDDLDRVYGQQQPAAAPAKAKVSFFPSSSSSSSSSSCYSSYASSGPSGFPPVPVPAPIQTMHHRLPTSPLSLCTTAGDAFTLLLRIHGKGDGNVYKSRFPAPCMYHAVLEMLRNEYPWLTKSHYFKIHFKIQGFGKAAMSWYIDGRSGEQNTAEEFSSEEEWEFFITCVLARLNELEDSASKRYVGMEVILPKA